MGPNVSEFCRCPQVSCNECNTEKMAWLRDRYSVTKTLQVLVYIYVTGSAKNPT